MSLFNVFEIAGSSMAAQGVTAPQINQALAKIQDGSFGICEGNPLWEEFFVTWKAWGDPTRDPDG